MAEAPAYAILGRGRWAARMHGVLAGEGRRSVSVADTRRGDAESEDDYKARIAAALVAGGAQITWLCVPPGPHTVLLMEAAIGAGLHAVAEKPWRCSRTETDSLLTLARVKGVIAAVHYEYCLLEAVEAWRRDSNQGARLRFNGCFHLSRPDHLGIPAMENLGSHLLAMRAYAVPQAAIAEIRCGYELPDERRAWVDRAGRQLASIDFLNNEEPVIQRFIAGMEAALDRTAFPFDLNFARRVADDVAALKLRQTDRGRLGLLL